MVTTPPAPPARNEGGNRTPERESAPAAPTPFPKPAVTGSLWPAYPGPTTSTLLSILFQLERTQWWPTETLLAQQMQQLGALTAHAARTVPFYRRRLQEAGIAGEKSLEPEVWHRLPILTRHDLQRMGKGLDSRKLPERHGATKRLSSSGSTGKPISVLTTNVCAIFWQAVTLRAHLWHRHDFSRTLGSIRKFRQGVGAYPDGLSLDNWGTAALVFPTGPAVGLHINTAIKDQIEWLQRRRPEYLTTFPSNLMALAIYCRDRGIALPGLRQVITTAELVSPELREACWEAWGLRVVDMYSAQEVSYVALQCPDHEHYHAQSEVAHVEILDDRDRPCGPGEIGRVVVTPLHNFATPLLRYEVGDYAEVGEACPCGRGLPVLRRILGRVRNVLIGPKGERYWPTFGSRTFTQIAPILQHQFVQKSVDTLEARLVTERPLSEEEEEALRRHIGSRLPFAMTILFTYHREIPRSEGGKYEDFISEVGA